MQLSLDRGSLLLLLNGACYRAMRIITCPGCNREITHYARDLCNTCYKRTYYPRASGNVDQVRPALALAREIGATAAAAVLSVGVERFRIWAAGEDETPGWALIAIRAEISRLRAIDNGD